MNKKRLLVLSSPSGGGKSTIAKVLLDTYSNLRLSVSATTRKMRGGEINGKHYHFLERAEFERKISDGSFIEYEEIFNNFYGTPKTEVETAFEKGECLLFDVDVKGAMSVRSAYPDDTLLLFISPPDLKTLELRLRNRSTETDEQILTRLSRAEMELSYKDKFDKVIINDDLERAVKETVELIGNLMEFKAK